VTSAIKLAGSSCKFLARASFAIAMYALQEMGERIRADLNEKKYYDNINDDDEFVV